MRGIGTSNGGLTTPPQVTVDASTDPSPVPDDFTTTFARVGPSSFVSWGHAGRYNATVFVSPNGKALFADENAEPGAGSVIAMTHSERTGEQKRGPTFFMQRDGTRWRYGVVGTGAQKDGAALCARCHAEAPRGGLFSLPTQ